MMPFSEEDAWEPYQAGNGALAVLGGYVNVYGALAPPRGPVGGFMKFNAAAKPGMRGRSSHENPT